MKGKDLVQLRKSIKNIERKEQFEEQTNDILLTIGKACFYILAFRKIFKFIQEKTINNFLKNN